LPGESLVHGVTAAEVQKVAGRENPTPPAGFHPLKDLTINRFCVLSHSVLVVKSMQFF
jgi:hypothetical protein